MYVPSLKLYHCNTKVNINRAASTKNYSILRATNDKYWIGDGVYFWDNLSNAKYWKKEKERKNVWGIQKVNFAIGSGIIRLNKLLDLTDSDIRKSLEDVFEEIYKVNPVLKNTGFGEKINYFLSEDPIAKSEYDVIKAHGNYPKQTTKLYYFDRFRVGLTPQIRTIYNVINNSAILSFNREVS